MANEKNVMSTAQPVNDNTPTAKNEKTASSKLKRRRRWGDRKEGRKLRTIEPMHRLMPYIMARRSDALNTFYDRIEISKADEFCRRKIREGKTSFGLLHVMLASYVRVVSQRPGINRFVSGQKIYARNAITVIMTVKKELSLNAPEAIVKVNFDPADTIDDVYEKFNSAAREAIDTLDKPSAVDRVAKILGHIPGLLLRWTIKSLNALDYWGWLPKSLLDLSPFHGSMVITSMGSLGINPVYHHIYDFGNLPVFISYGTKKTVYEYDRKGNLEKCRYIDIKAVTDERICDGHYFASAFKLYKKYIERPDALEEPPMTIVEDID